MHSQNRNMPCPACRTTPADHDVHILIERGQKFHQAFTVVKARQWVPLAGDPRQAGWMHFSLRRFPVNDAFWLPRTVPPKSYDGRA